MATEDHKTIELEWIADIAAKLSLVEIGLGAVLHGLHIPSSGTFLSLNQGFFLCRASRESLKHDSTHFAPIQVSSVASVLKSLSPAGNKWGPMMSIWMQGALFNLGTLTLGRNLVGEVAGMVLMSPWSFIQPLITYFFFYGSDLFKAIEYALGKIAPWGPSFTQGLVILFLAKMLLAAAVPFVSKRRAALIEGVPLLPEREPVGAFPTWRGVLKDMTRPLFVFSFILFVVFVTLTNGVTFQTVVQVLRPLAIAIVFFWLCRSPWTTSAIGKLRKYPTFRGFFQLVDLTIEKMRQRPSQSCRDLHA